MSAAFSLDALREAPFQLPLSVKQAVVPFFPQGAAVASGDFRNAAATVRKAQTAVARELASVLLQQLGCKSPVVGSNEDRSPRWPAGFIGSITHTDTLIGVAVGRADRGYTIGIDIERIVDQSIAHEINAACITDTERRFACGNALLFTTMVFSAKEALFKAIYPLTGQLFDFTDAEMVDVDWHAGRALFSLCANVGCGFVRGTLLPATFISRGGSVYTSACVQHSSAERV